MVKPTPIRHEPVTLGDLKPDAKNARRHNPRNVGQIERSIQQDGFGRSLLVANDGTIIAGNATADALGALGMEDVQIVNSDGTRPIVVRRTDIEPGSPAFHRLAIADNRAAELATWDKESIASLIADGSVDPEEFWMPPELAKLLDAPQGPGVDAAAEWTGMPEYENEEQRPVAQLTVYFASIEAKRAFGAVIGQPVSDKERWVWHPEAEGPPAVRWTE